MLMKIKRFLGCDDNHDLCAMIALPILFLINVFYMQSLVNYIFIGIACVLQLVCRYFLSLINKIPEEEREDVMRLIDDFEERSLTIVLQNLHKSDEHLYRILEEDLNKKLKALNEKHGTDYQRRIRDDYDWISRIIEVARQD